MCGVLPPLIMTQRFFGDGSYAIIGPHGGGLGRRGFLERGMGLGYGVGSLGKIVLGLALMIS